MKSMTFKVAVFGDSHDEIVEKAEEEIQSFLEVSDEEDFSKRINYELLIEKDEAFDAEFIYKANVIARIK
jgi:hypothetical protein